MSALYSSIAEQIERSDYAITDNFLPESLAEMLQSDLENRYNEGNFRHAAIGKGIEEKKIYDVRGDFIYWLTYNDLNPVQLEFWRVINDLRVFLSEYFRISLKRFECHMAVYPPGNFYLKHLDQFRGTSDRIVSFAYYINKDWANGDGGEIRIFENNKTIDFPPLFNRLCCFRSDVVEHEVLITNKNRYSITGWMRRD